MPDMKYRRIRNGVEAASNRSTTMIGGLNGGWKGEGVLERTVLYHFLRKEGSIIANLTLQVDQLPYYFVARYCEFSIVFIPCEILPASSSLLLTCLPLRFWIVGK